MTSNNSVTSRDFTGRWLVVTAKNPLAHAILGSTLRVCTFRLTEIKVTVLSRSAWRPGISIGDKSTASGTTRSGMGFQTPLYKLSDYLQWTTSGKDRATADIPAGGAGWSPCPGAIH